MAIGSARLEITQRRGDAEAFLRRGPFFHHGDTKFFKRVWTGAAGRWSRVACRFKTTKDMKIHEGGKKGMTKEKRMAGGFVVAGGLVCLCLSARVGRGAEERRVEIDLRDAKAFEQWHSGDNRARVAGGELVLDGRQTPCRVFLKEPAFGDVTLSAAYRVEKSAGVMAVGFVLGSTDSATSTYVHFDSRSAILCR
ncbi:MAG: hypothetical protein GX565_12255, partial [Lentisphaerae bacterium]|nr:hypothetical protein [Lentisphaerota bacterium]